MLNPENNDAQLVSNITQLTKAAYTISEVARLLEPPVNPITIYRQVWAGKIKVLDVPGRIRIPRSELERFFNRVVVYTPKKLVRKTVKAEAI